MRISKITNRTNPESDNRKADFLAKIGRSLLDYREWKIAVLGIGKEALVLAISQDEIDWRAPILRFFEGERLGNKNELEITERRARFYYVVEWMLFRKTFRPPDVKCLTQ